MTAEEQGTATQDTTQDDDRPKPYPHEGDSRPDDDSGDSSSAPAADSNDSGSSSEADSEKSESDSEKSESDSKKSEGDSEKSEGDGDFTYGEDESQDFVDRDKIDFDPADGLYTGSAVDGDSDIPGPSEGDIREAQEELGDDEEDGDAGAKKAAEKFIEENDVDLEEAKKGEAIAGSAQSSGDKGDDS